MPLQHLNLIAFLTFAGFCCAQTLPRPAPQTENAGVEGVIKIGPTLPGPVRPGIQSSRPLANTTFIVTNQTGSVAEFTTDDQGRFKVSLKPGHYTIARKDQKKGIGRYGPFDVDVVAGQMTQVEWQCDTGMR